MTYTADDIVDFIMDKDPTNLNLAVDAIMSSYVQDAIEMRKQAIGKSLGQSNDD